MVQGQGESQTSPSEWMLILISFVASPYVREQWTSLWVTIEELVAIKPREHNFDITSHQWKIKLKKVGKQGLSIDDVCL